MKVHELLTESFWATTTEYKAKDPDDSLTFLNVSGVPGILSFGGSGRADVQKFVKAVEAKVDLDPNVVSALFSTHSPFLDVIEAALSQSDGKVDKDVLTVADAAWGGLEAVTGKRAAAQNWRSASAVRDWLHKIKGKTIKASKSGRYFSY